MRAGVDRTLRTDFFEPSVHEVSKVAGGKEQQSKPPQPRDQTPARGTGLRGLSPPAACQASFACLFLLEKAGDGLLVELDLRVDLLLRWRCQRP